MKRIALLLSTLALLAGMPLRAQEKPKTDKQASETSHAEARPTAFYRVDLTMTELEDNKKVNTRHYVMHVSDAFGRSGTKFGTRVPVPSGDNGKMNYVDIGLNINMGVNGRERDLLDINIELSSFAIPEQAKQANPGLPVMRQVQTSNMIPLTSSKSIAVATLDDPNSTRRYQFDVVLTKL
jgi:hypothetical protein